MARRQLEGLIHDHAQAVGGLHRDERLRLQLAELDARAHGQRMILRHDGEELLRPEVVPREVVGHDHVRAEAEVGLALRDLLGEIGGVVLVQLDADLRVTRVEFAEEHGQDVAAEGMQKREVHDAAVPLRRRRDLLLRRRELPEHPVDMKEEVLPCRGQRRALSRAVQQLRAELILQLRDGAAQRRLRDGAGLRRFRELMDVGERLKVFEL